MDPRFISVSNSDHASLLDSTISGIDSFSGNLNNLRGMKGPTRCVGMLCGPWSRSSRWNSGSSGPEASAGLPVILGGEGGANAVDPHLWLDPVRVETSVATIAASFSRVDPSGAAVFQANAAKLRQDLARIDGLFAAGLQTCARRVFITQHEAFAYLAARYNLTQVAIQGLSPDQEPTPAKVQEILNVINATGPQVGSFEELVNPAVAQTLANEAKVQTMVLSPIEGLTAEERANGDTYLSLMEMNLQNLRIALECA